MKINRNNYELYFLDYLDGNLTDQDIRMLEDFLLINPDLRIELEGTEKIALSPGPVFFNQKDLLIKPDLNLPVTELNFEDFCIASSEGDLNDQQNSGLSEYIRENPVSGKIMLFFSKLHLNADEKIIYSGKNKLKKNLIFIPREILYPVLSVAAAVTFIIIIYLNKHYSTEVLNNITSELPVYSLPNPDTDNSKLGKENQVVNKVEPVAQQASVSNFVSPKTKKKTINLKAKDIPAKVKTDTKNKESMPPQRLNPSFQIRLPSIAENQTVVSIIDGGKITFNNVKTSTDNSEYLSLSEYARKELAEKILGNKNPLNAHLSAWKIADAGITGLNRLTGGVMKLEKRIGEDGNITAYSFNSKLLSFSTTSVK